MLGLKALAGFYRCCPASGAIDPEAQLWIDITYIEQQFAKAFRDAGGVLLSGTDPTLPGVVAGFGVHRQLELLVGAGFSPVEATKISSHHGARFMARLDEIGTLEAGKRADMFLVRGRPDERISESRNIVTVFKDGIGYDSAALRESVKGLVGH